MFVVYWHNILPDSIGVWNDALPRITLEEFEKQIGWIARHFEPWPLAEVLNYRDDRISSKRRLAITFDDGFRGVHEFALPVLKKFGWTGSVFILNQFEETDPSQNLMHSEILEILFRITREPVYLNHRLGSDPEKRLAYGAEKIHLRPLTPQERTEFCHRASKILKVSMDEVREFAANHPTTYSKLNLKEQQDLVSQDWTLGAHTTHHPRLTTLSPTQQESEIGPSENYRRSGSPRIFAYPYGDFDSQSASVVESLGFDAAFTTKPYPIQQTDNPFQLPRMSFGSLWNRAMRYARQR
tara:strand:+ start:3218 stop:4108 length:891 start_codon:yes stop_codon:yes gene_type:complete